MLKETADQKPKNIWDSEAEQNWVGFWDLLLKEDRRQNPNLYKKSETEEENNKNL